MKRRNFYLQLIFVIGPVLAFLFFSACQHRASEKSLPSPTTAISYPDASSPSPTELPRESVSDLIGRAQILAMEGKEGEALSLLDEAEKIEPENHRVYMERALIIQKTGNLKAALDTCDKGLRKIPGSLKLMEEKANILSLMGKPEESARLNLRILKTYNEDSTGSPDMVTLARQQIASALKANPKNDEIRKCFEDALVDLDESLKKAPGDELLLKEKGYMLQHAGLYDKALEVFKAIDEMEKENLYVAFEIGNTYFLAGNYSRAEETFEKTIKNNPKNFRSYRNFGRYWMERGKGAKGKDAAGFFEKSARYFEKALSYSELPIDTSFQQFRAAEARFHIWKITGIENDRRAAIQAFKKYSKLAPEYTTTEIADPFVRELGVGN